MNMLLFLPHEWGKPLPPGDRRTAHIIDILKSGKGDSLRVGMLGEGTGMAVIEEAPRRDRELPLRFPDRLDSISFPALRLVIGHPRPGVFQRLLKDLSSLGVESIHWVHTMLGEKSYLASSAWEQAQIDRQLHLGLEQGGHCMAPRIHKHYSLRRCLEHPEMGEGCRIYLHPQNGSTRIPSLLRLMSAAAGPEDSSFRSAARSGVNSRSDSNTRSGPAGSAAAACVLAIGSERGWTDEELRQFDGGGFSPAHLGQAVLRTENAAFSAALMAQLVMTEETSLSPGGHSGTGIGGNE